MSDSGSTQRAIWLAKNSRGAFKLTEGGLKLDIFKDFKKEYIPINFGSDTESKFYKVPTDHRVRVACIAYVWYQHPATANAMRLIKVRGHISLVDYLKDKGFPWIWFFDAIDEILG